MATRTNRMSVCVAVSVPVAAVVERTEGKRERQRERGPAIWLNVCSFPLTLSLGRSSISLADDRQRETGALANSLKITSSVCALTLAAYVCTHPTSTLTGANTAEKQASVRLENL